MTNRFTPGGGIAPFIVAVIAGALAAVFMLRDGMARRAVARGDYASAMRIAPTLPDAAAAAAEAALARGDAADAMRLAAVALARVPLDARALRVRGMAAERTGDVALAYRTMEVAGRLGWRDVPTQTWIFARSLEGGDVATALQRGDALLRQSNSQSPLFEALAAASVAPAMREPLVALLASDPPWRFRFFQYAEGFAPAAVGQMAELALAVDRGPTPLTAQEAAFAASALVARGEDVAASRLYRTLAAGRPTLRPGLIQDGGFERFEAGDGQVTRSPFDWLIQAGAAEPAEIDLHPGGGGNALRLPAAVDGALLTRQILLLPPGRYRLGWTARGEEGSPALRLQLACRGGDGAALIDLRFTAGPDWAGRAAAFTVPPRCASQAVTVMGAGAQAAAWIDDVTIAPLAGTPLARRPAHPPAGTGLATGGRLL